MEYTVLRFAVPNELQIIDQRVYRFITPDKDCPDVPYNIEKKITLYFDYITQLTKICKEYDIAFYDADRILYQLDKTLNKKFRLKTSA